MAGPGKILLDAVSPLLEFIAPLAPGEIFPYFFTMEMFQRALLSALLVTIVAGILGTYLLIQKVLGLKMNLVKLDQSLLQHTP